MVSEYKDVLLENGLASTQAVRDASLEGLMAAGMPVGVALLLQVATETVYSAGAAAGAATATPAGPQASTAEHALAALMQQCHDRLSPGEVSMVSEYKDVLLENGLAARRRSARPAGDPIAAASLTAAGAGTAASANAVPAAASAAVPEAVADAHLGRQLQPGQEAADNRLSHAAYPGALHRWCGNNPGALRKVRRAAPNGACAEHEADVKMMQRLLANYTGKQHTD
ncbi:hypothetical protein OEZ86_012162 [Tetradesmus obliquus]|nr:hypothetical protein OEZ86_012162 [Tetradesmus obliquus]